MQVIAAIGVLGVVLRQPTERVRVQSFGSRASGHTGVSASLASGILKSTSPYKHLHSNVAVFSTIDGVQPTAARARRVLDLYTQAWLAWNDPSTAQVLDHDPSSVVGYVTIVDGAGAVSAPDFSNEAAVVVPADSCSSLEGQHHNVRVGYCQRVTGAQTAYPDIRNPWSAPLWNDVAACTQIYCRIGDQRITVDCSVEPLTIDDIGCGNCNHVACLTPGAACTGHCAIGEDCNRILDTDGTCSSGFICTCS